MYSKKIILNGEKNVHIPDNANAASKVTVGHILPECKGHVTEVVWCVGDEIVDDF